MERGGRDGRADESERIDEDERFRTFYDAMAPNGADVPRDAIDTWAGREAEGE